jgi:pyruvate formate lyase activating enzyme
MKREEKGIIFNIQKYSVNDGEGIRTIVFFKGCPLKCVWCSNPESQKVESEIFFMEERCIGCGRCEKACGTGAREGGVWNRSRCVNCLACADACLSEALEIKGREMTISEIVEEVEKDRVFYENSSGGITLSGGEPLMQPAFAAALAAELKRKYFDVAIETTGFARYEDLLAVVKNCDLVLYDIKHMDSAAHKKYTGVPNERILDNLKKLAARGKNIIVRMPVLGGINADEDNVRKTAAYAASLGIGQMDLLPYHRFGEAKYKKLNKQYECGATTPSEEEMQKLKAICESYGIKVTIGG